MDRRLIPANTRVAASHLRGQVEAAQFVDGVTHSVTGHPFLCAAPEGTRDRQLLWGDTFLVYERRTGWVFGQSVKDGYVGYLPESAVTASLTPTHRVTQRETWVYATPVFKQPAQHMLSFGAQLSVIAQDSTWAEVALAGEASTHFIPSRHIAPIEHHDIDPISVAEKFLSTPYVWAGNTGYGIDCSGLVQAALLACGVKCPGDSDLQEALLGEALDPAAPLRRGDLLFWKGHVSMVADAERIIHANAYHMCVSYEAIGAAITRIEAQGDGPVTSRKRLN